MGVVLWVACFLATTALFAEGRPRTQLSVTFGRFQRLPLTESDAVAEGFRKISTDCSNNGLFSGNRYLQDNNTAVIVLYDSQGYVAGIQNAYSKSFVDSNNIAYRFGSEPFVQDSIDGEDYYVLTAYFVNPDVICDSGRTQEEFERSPVGTELNLVGGTLIQSDSMIPNNETDVGGTLWTKGHCFPAMGDHFWYNMRTDMDCSQEFFPAFVLYDKNELTGFGFTVPGYFENYEEHAPTEALPQFINPVPQCLVDLSEAYGLTSLHVYFEERPAFISCN